MSGAHVTKFNFILCSLDVMKLKHANENMNVAFSRDSKYNVRALPSNFDILLLYQISDEYIFRFNSWRQRWHCNIDNVLCHLVVDFLNKTVQNKIFLLN
jgi:hypothetical protein